MKRSLEGRRMKVERPPQGRNPKRVKGLEAMRMSSVTARKTVWDMDGGVEAGWRKWA